jgi:hypothetical protein
MTTTRTRRRSLLPASLAAIGLLAGVGGCAAFGIVGALGQSFESQKLIEVAAVYPGLEGSTVAVVVNVGLDIRWSSPTLGTDVTNFVSRQIAENVPDVQVVNPAAVLNWQFRTAQWEALPYGAIAEQLNVDRVVFIDIYEYRLHPPGNRYLWEGVCAATVGIIERDGFDVDAFVDSFEVTASHPDIEGLGRDQVAEGAIAAGLKSKFITRVAWLFYKHEEPKYPDLYKPELDA